MHLSLRPQGAEPGQGAPVVVQTDIITRRSDQFLAMLRSTQSEDEMQRLQCLAMPQTKEQAMSILVARSLLGCTLSRELYKVCRKLGMREMLLRLSEILSTLSPDQAAKLSAKEGECMLLRRETQNTDTLSWTITDQSMQRQLVQALSVST